MPQNRETELNVSVLAAALWRKALLLCLLAILAAVAIYAAMSFVDPVYTADARILIEERESPLTRPRDVAVESSNLAYDESGIQSQVEILRSREIANAVIENLDLTRRPQFDPATDPSPLTNLLVLLGLKTHPVEDTIRHRIMEAYFSRLSVYPVGRSRVLGVEFESSDPELAAEVVNAVADAFIALQQGAKRETALAATEWLENEISRLRDRVAESDAKVATYRSREGLFQVGGVGATVENLSTQQLSDLNAELVRAKAARSEAEARSQLIRSVLDGGGSLEASPEVLDSALIQRLQERQVALRSEIAELSTTLLPAHPKIRGLQRQLSDLEGQIRQEAEKVLRSVETAARVAAAREQSLAESLTQAKSDASTSNQQEIELRALEREATAQRELLESLLGRYREALARTDADYLPADARVISRAVPPEDPTFPKKGMMAIAAAFGTILVGASIVMLREFTSGRAFRETEVVRTVERLPQEVVGVEPETFSFVPPEPEDVPRPAAEENARTAEPEEGLAPSEEAPVELADGPTPVVVPVAEDGKTSEPDLVLAAEVQPELDLAGQQGGVSGAELIAPVVEDATPEIEAEIDEDRPGTAQIADLLASPAVRTVVFAGAKGGENAGDIALAAARRAASENLRIVMIDIGVAPSEVLGGFEEPGLGDLLRGEAAFGEVIRRDDESGVHVIPMGGADKEMPQERLPLVLGALSHTYDKVVVVADALADWPAVDVALDLIAVVCAADVSDEIAEEAYEEAIGKGAKSALIVRFGVDDPAAPDTEAA